MLDRLRGNVIPMPNRKPNNGLVGVSLYIPMQILEQVQHLEGNNLSKKLRTLIEKRLSQATPSQNTDRGV